MVSTQRLAQHIDAIKTVFWHVGFWLPVFLVSAAHTEPMMVGPLTLRPLLSWLYCSFGAVGIVFFLWACLLQTRPPGLLSVVASSKPICGLLFSAVLYGARPLAELMVGVLAVEFRILLVTLEKRQLRNETRLRSDVELRRAA